jgi:LPS export ABC transporter permease LptG/LPS export ABC transporter permease LptF
MSFITRLDRHVAREVFVPSVLAFFVYTLLLLMNGLFSLMEQVVVFGVSAKDALAVIWIAVPNIAILTIPVSFLFGVLLAAGRMSSENELTALLAAGIPARRLYKPVLAMAVFLTGVSLYMTFGVIPQSNLKMRELRTKMFSSGSAIGRIQPQIFYDELPQILLYVEDVDSVTGNWKNVLIHRVVSPDEQQLTLARRGRIVTTGGEEISNGDSSPSTPWIILEDVVNHTFLRNHPEKFLTSMVQTHAFRPEAESSTGQKITYRLSLKELNTDQLLEKIRSGRSPEDSASDSPKKPERLRQEMRMASVEFHRRLTIPAAAITFALLALPLGIGVRAGSRGRGFLFSIMIVIVYYILNSYGEFLVIEKGIPALIGMWIPNFVLAASAVFLSLRMGRWLGERQRPESLISKLIMALRRTAGNRFRKASDGIGKSPPTGSFPRDIQRRMYGGGFPTLLDRYVIRRMMSALLLVLLSTISLYVIGDLTSHVDEIARNSPPAPIVLAYYWYTIPRALFDVLPFGLLISVITLLTVLERNQELTALKASGLSVFRVAVPLLVAACVGVGAMWFLGEEILPKADAQSTKLFNIIKGVTTTSSGSAAHRNWLIARDGRTFYRFLRYDLKEKRLIRFSMFRVDTQMRLRYTLFAPRVHFDNGSWIADGGWLRNIDEDGDDDFRRITSPTEIGIIEGPSYFGQEIERPDEMSQSELRNYINELEDSGYRPSKLIVRWHQKFSTPLSVLVLVLLAIPFSLGGRRGGTRSSTMQGVAVALALGIGYFILLVPLFGKLGEAEFLPPFVGAWIPVVLGVLFAINRMTHIRT